MFMNYNHDLLFLCIVNLYNYIPTCLKTFFFRCLRYASTGNFPPGSYNGRNFVHDPKMNKNSVVIGHLKLQFIGNDNKRYVIARSVQAKQGPKTVAIKTLDSTMRLV